MDYWLTVWHDHTCTRAHKVITRAHARAHNHYQKYLAFLEQIPKCSIRIHFLITQRKLLLETLSVFWLLILVYIDQSYALLVIVTMPSSSKLASIDSNGLRSSRRVEWKRLWRLAQGSLRSRRLEVVGTRHERGITTCLPRARPFSLSPATSKRLLRSLGAGLPCKVQRFLACDKALRGALVAGRERKELAGYGF